MKRIGPLAINERLLLLGILHRQVQDIKRTGAQSPPPIPTGFGTGRCKECHRTISRNKNWCLTCLNRLSDGLPNSLLDNPHNEL